MNNTESLWYVQLADGDVHRVTLDQLDEGFQAGNIDEKTMVLAAGAARWTPLGQLAGIDEVDSTHARPSGVAAKYVAPQSFAPQPAAFVPVLLNTHRPVSVDVSDLEVAVGLPRRSGKRWFFALVVVSIVSGMGVVVVKRPTWLAPYWSRLEPQRVAMKSWGAGAVPSLVQRVRHALNR